MSCCFYFQFWISLRQWWLRGLNCQKNTVKFHFWTTSSWILFLRWCKHITSCPILKMWCPQHKQARTLTIQALAFHFQNCCRCVITSNITWHSDDRHKSLLFTCPCCNVVVHDSRVGEQEILNFRVHLFWAFPANPKEETPFSIEMGQQGET